MDRLMKPFYPSGGLPPPFAGFSGSFLALCDVTCLVTASRAMKTHSHALATRLRKAKMLTPRQHFLPLHLRQLFDTLYHTDNCSLMKLLAKLLSKMSLDKRAKQDKAPTSGKFLARRVRLQTNTSESVHRLSNPRRRRENYQRYNTSQRCRHGKRFACR
jgi:hypothetical protein